MNPFETARNMTRNLIGKINELLSVFTGSSVYNCFAIAVSICIIVSLLLVCKYLYKDRLDVDKVDLVEREHKGVYMNFIVKAPDAVEADRLIESYLNGKIDPNKEIDIWIG